MDRQRLTILGSTGSVGTSTLDVVARHRDRFEIAALTARDHVDVLFDQCVEFRPRMAVMLDPAAAQGLQQRLLNAGVKCDIRSGIQALEDVASLPDVDTVMAAIVGIAGLRPTLEAARAGKKILLASNRWPEWPSHIRVTVGTFEEMTKFNAALAKVVQEGPLKATA